ncbi:hypothetical protein WJU16_06520 [Chitinophaga pollutisoli]|uniref:ZU5 domain-containing protein n=1 Tax=Chitinophaga pollutisoli TaxID=3133966 RepID=A0ABZ2YTH7_9BACT
MTRFSVFLLAVALLSACNHHKRHEDTPVPQNPQNPQEPQGPKGVARPIGTSLGTAVTKDIGPQGGNIASADGKLRITVPAGAVAANTTFSVEPVTNTLPGSPGIAYRLKPEGKFPKPLTLQFTYNTTDLDSTDAEALFLAFQPADGIWRMVTRTQLDKQNRTLTVETDHFSTWAPYALFWLTSLHEQVQTGKSTGLAVRTTDNYLAANLERTEVEIMQDKVLDDMANIRNWQLDGEGNLAPDGARPTALYTAPGAMPEISIVKVSVEVHNFIPAGKIPGRGATGKLILQRKIRIVEDTWHYGTIDGVNFNTSHRWFLAQGGILNIEGIVGGMVGLTITAFMDEPKPGNYRWDIAQGDNTAQAVWLSRSPGGWISGYHHCRDGYDINSPGALVIEIVETVNGVKYVEGHYTVNVYDPAGACEPPTKRFQGFFRVKSR